MPYVSDIHENNGLLLDIIENSKKSLFLICPYLKIHSKLKGIIEKADARGVNIIVIYGKRALNMEELLWLKSLKHIIVGFSETLHAKYYSNEEAALITSLNLYDYSQINNEELGVFFTLKDDRQMYYESLEIVNRIIDNSKIEYATIEYSHHVDEGRFGRAKYSSLFKVLDSITDNIDTMESKSVEGGAYCIMCGNPIERDQDFPFCDSCNREWSKTRDSNRITDYCYICGKKTRTSCLKPACLSCFAQNNALVTTKRDNLLKISKK